MLWLVKNKEEDYKPSSSYMAGVVAENFEGSKFVIAVSVSKGHYNGRWVLELVVYFIFT
jgi:hypothetical protein